MTAAAGVPPAGAARIVRVEERARFRCARCGETFADASSLVSHKVWHRRHDANDAPGEEDRHRDGGVTGARGGPARGHPSGGVRRGNDVAGALTHAQRDLLREGEQLMRRLDTFASSSSTSRSFSSMGRLHATSGTSLAQRLRAEKEERARRDGIAGWTSPTPSPTPAPPPQQQQQPERNPGRGIDDQNQNQNQNQNQKVDVARLETDAPPRHPAAPRYGSEVPDEPARPPRVSSPHDAETIRYREDEDEDDEEEDKEEEASSSTGDAAEGTDVTTVTADGGSFRPACAPIALRKAPGQIRREEAAARRQAARAAAREAVPPTRPRSENGGSRPGTVDDETAGVRPTLPRWQGGTVIRRDRTTTASVTTVTATGGTKGDAAESEERDRDARWGDPGGRLLDRARAAAVKIAAKETAREARRLALKDKVNVEERGTGAGGDAGARKGGRDRTAPEGLAAGAIFETLRSGDDSDDEARGSGVEFLARYRALVRERDVGVLREREEREARAREEEEWKSSRSDEDEDDEDEDEGKVGRDGLARAVASNEEDESFVEELTPEEEDELAEFERLEREVTAEVGAA